MSRMVQVYNPVHGQRINQVRLNVMGRVLQVDKIKTISVLVDNTLIRKVRPAQSGAFECRTDLSRLGEGKHELEIRAMVGHRTERIVVPFYIMEKPVEAVPEEPKAALPPEPIASEDSAPT